MRTHIVLTALALLTTALTSSPARAEAAAPRVIVVEGALLDAPRVFADWEENLRIARSIERSLTAPRVDESRLATRPRLEVLFYEGISEEAAANLIAAPTQPDPLLVPQRYAYWPGTAYEPAVIAGHIATSDLIALFQQRGVPVYVEAPPPPPTETPAQAAEQSASEGNGRDWARRAGAWAALALVSAAAVAVWRRTPRQPAAPREAS